VQYGDQGEVESTTAHEIGHILGLGDIGSLYYPSGGGIMAYKGRYSQYNISNSDIETVLKYALDAISGKTTAGKHGSAKVKLTIPSIKPESRNVEKYKAEIKGKSHGGGGCLCGQCGPSKMTTQDRKDAKQAGENMKKTGAGPQKVPGEK
jgi:hypothetical protein